MTTIDVPALVVRPEDILPDGVERTTVDGIDIRKGTVAAFVRNAQRWLDPTTPKSLRDALAQEMRRAVPTLGALGVLTVFEIRDERLRSAIALDGQ